MDKKVLDTTTATLHVTCSLSSDQLKLFINLSPLPTADTESTESQPSKGPPPTVDTLEQQVRAAIAPIVDDSLLDLAVLRNALGDVAKGEKVEGRRIAKGKPPQNSRDGKIVFLVKPLTVEAQLLEQDSGRVNLKELHLFDNIEAEQVVARIYPPRQGEDGIAANGTVLKAPEGKEAQFQLSANLELASPNKEKNFIPIIAKDSGYLWVENQKINLSNELKIDGDVDYTTGNISFIGSVVILGSVRPGFNVKAKKNILINGVVEGGFITSQTGSIEVKGQVVALEPCRLVAAEDITVTIAQDAELVCGGTLNVARESRNCKLESNSVISLKQGTLLGGTASVVCGLEAAQIGNQSGVQTDIILCSRVELSSEFRKLSDTILTHEKAISVLQLHLGPLAQNPKRVILLQKGLREKMEKLLKKLEQLEKSLQTLLEKNEKLLQDALTAQDSQVAFDKTMHPGSTVKLAEHIFAPKEVLKGPASVVFDAATSEFVLGAQKPIACNFNQKEESHE